MRVATTHSLKRAREIERALKTVGCVYGILADGKWIDRDGNEVHNRLTFVRVTNIYKAYVALVTEEGESVMAKMAAPPYEQVLSQRGETLLDNRPSIIFEVLSEGGR